jgi:polyhydroxyalkanoate synthesis regulator phasin
MKKRIRLTQSDIHKIVEESVEESLNNILNESLNKRTRNPNTLKNITEYLNGNRGLAEMFIEQASSYIDEAVKSGELQNYEENEVYDFFWDVIADADKKDDTIYNLVNILKDINRQWGRRSDSYGFLAELMEEYYKSEYLNNII